MELRIVNLEFAVTGYDYGREMDLSDVCVCGGFLMVVQWMWADEDGALKVGVNNHAGISPRVHNA